MSKLKTKGEGSINAYYENKLDDLESDGGGYKQIGGYNANRYYLNRLNRYDKDLFSGYGKSTTINSICGLIHKYEGEINFNKISLIGQPSYKIAQMGIGLVPEGRRAFSNLTVLENLIATARDGDWLLEGIFSLFPRLEERKYQIASSLSGGEQQMLVIGRALMTNPKLLILDEATEGLSPTIRIEIWKVIEILKSKKYY